MALCCKERSSFDNSLYILNYVIQTDKLNLLEDQCVWSHVNIGTF